uniref:NADH-ubiquinone oxidoreductase chain 6 n=1 Tax=Chrotogonus sp. TAMUIC IGC OR284 TaxID=2591243 RepID=A0A516IMZ5_9ORTH|nr:NADH dehydrogenase subunit 6 [Chrotogonus sp. TAMUIC IGC OR284]
MMTTSNILNLNFTKLNHPMSMMFMIIIQTLLIGMMIGTLMESFWLSYILFLTFLGGMLVLFIYITSIASNEMFNLNIKLLMISFLLLTSMFFMLSMTEFIFMNDFIKNSDSSETNLHFDITEMSMSLLKLYNYPNFLVTIMMMIYLFLALLAVVKITNIHKGPIRKMN